jgi:hypothetical protein
MIEDRLRLFIIAVSGVAALVFAFVSASLWLNSSPNSHGMAWAMLTSSFFAAIAIWEVKS